MYGSMPYGYCPVSKYKPEEVRRMRAYIRALIYQIDEAVGEILQHVDLENTVVFFTTDHGDYYGYRGLMAKTPFFPLDDLARVPFFCAGAGVVGGRRVADCVNSPDFVPTALELAGLPSLPLDTESLIPHFRNVNPPVGRIAYTSSHDKYPYWSAKATSSTSATSRRERNSSSTLTPTRRRQRTASATHLTPPSPRNCDPT